MYCERVCVHMWDIQKTVADVSVILPAPINSRAVFLLVRANVCACLYVCECSIQLIGVHIYTFTSICLCAYMCNAIILLHQCATTQTTTTANKSELEKGLQPEDLCSETVRDLFESDETKTLILFPRRISYMQ